MNNWLGFSLSPQEQFPSSQTDLHHHHHNQDHSQNSVSHRLGFNSDEHFGTVVSGDCFDLTSADSTSPFGILEAFNRNNNHSQEWNMKGVEMISENNYKTSSELSTLMAIPRNSQKPKLENFLGGHSFSDHEQKLHCCTSSDARDYMFIPKCSLQLPSDDTTKNARTENNSCRKNNNNSSIGLSMIKTWLRNQPAPAPSQPATNNVNGGGAQSLSLSMSTVSQSGSSLTLLNGNGGINGAESSSPGNNKQQKTVTGTTTSAATKVLNGQTGAIEAVPKRSIDTFGQRTSIYRGVTRHRWTGRYEAHLWDNSCRREGQTRKGRQVYLGGYDKEEKAARAYDLAALKYWGTTTTTNFPISNYEKELEEMKHMTRQEYIASLRRKSSGFSRGASIYRGVTRHHQHGRWQARIGRVAGNKDLYLGTFKKKLYAFLPSGMHLSADSKLASAHWCILYFEAHASLGSQEEAAEAYDIAAIKFRGLNAVTNFDMSRYDINSILEGSTLPIGGAAKRLKDVEQAAGMTVGGQRLSIIDDDNMSSQLTADGFNNYSSATAAAYHRGWPAITAFQQAQHQTYGSLHFPYGQRIWCKQEQEDFHDQLQLGNNNNTHNFLQPSVFHNLMNVESSSLEHSPSYNNSVIYSNGSYNQAGYGSNTTGGFVIPMGTVIAANNNDQGFEESTDQVAAAAKVFGFENTFSSAAAAAAAASCSDPYLARNLYDISQQQPSANHPQGSVCNNWVPTAVPTLAQRSNNLSWISNFYSVE